MTIGAVLFVVASALAAPNVIYNTDGCDLYLYPDEKPITEEAFCAERLDFARSANVGTVSYCPQSSGFGYFTCSKAGDWMTNELRRIRGGVACHNATAEFAAKGLDSLEMCGRFCRRHGKKFFLSIRVNDMHDAAGTIDNPNPHFSPFKRRHPECLFGTGKPKPNGRPDIGRWSGVDFSHAAVRDYMRNFVRAFAEDYDFDGIEYDFNRHMSLFSSVVRGGVASDVERDMMTGLMRELRTITEDAAKRRGHPIRVHVRMPDSIGYLREVGIDAERWFAEKLVDGWIGAGYFRLNRWRTSVEIAHRHGVAFYASLDESRVPAKARKARLPQLPGRTTQGAEGRAFYAARIASALAEGCDGVYLFNLEGPELRDVVETCGRLEDAPKCHFVSGRGSGGAQPHHYLKDGDRFVGWTCVDPLRPMPMTDAYGKGFEIAVGDARPGPARLAVATDLKEGEPLDVRVNGVERALRVDADGIARTELADGLIVTGDNRFALRTSTEVAGRGRRLYDLSLRLKESGGQTPKGSGGQVLGAGGQALAAATERRVCAGEDASFSPDGGNLVFQRAEGDDYAVYVRDGRTGDERRVSPSAGSAVHPEWGPGGQLVWTRGNETRTALAARGGATGWNLEVLSNGVVRTLTRGRHRAFSPSYGPDGRIYFVSEAIKPEAGSTDAYSGNRTGVGVLAEGTNGWYRKIVVLNDSNTGVADPHVSSDGKWLVRSEVAGYTVPWRIVVSPLDDPEKRTYLTDKDMVGVSPVFSPDAKTVAFCGCREGDGGWRIYLVDRAGGNLRPFAIGERPSFSPDGRAIVYDRDGQVFAKELK